MTTLAQDRKTTLLLVDDDPAMVQMMVAIVHRQFHDEIAIQAVTDPAQARNALEEELIDILVTDIEMPGISGLGLLRCAKRRNALTQVLFITGHSSLDTLSDALELGATDYLLKPLDRTEFVEILGQALYRVRRWRKALAGTLTARR